MAYRYYIVVLFPTSLTSFQHYQHNKATQRHQRYNTSIISYMRYYPPHCLSGRGGLCVGGSYTSTNVTINTIVIQRYRKES